MKEIRDIFGETLVELGQETDKVVVLDADLYTSTKVDYFRDAFPNRFIQLGIAEQNMFGWAAGLAADGYIPFPSTFACFAAKRACDQISVSIAYPKLNVKIPGSYAGISAISAGATHQAMEDIAIMRSLPEIKVLAAADGIELKQMMKAIVEYKGPVYFRVLRMAVPNVFDQSYKFDWKPVLLREGSDIVIISTGFMTHRALWAADLLEKDGIKASVLHVPCIKPLDSEKILELAQKCGAVVTAENHSVVGGLGGAVAELLAETCPTMMRKVGFNDCFVETGEQEAILRKYGVTEYNIVAATKDLLNYKR